MHTTSTLELFNHRAATWADIPDLVDFCNRVMTEQTGRPDWTVEEAEDEFSEPGFTMEENVRLWYDGDGQLTAACIVFNQQVLPVRPGALLFILPGLAEYQELGLELLKWGEGVARLAVPRCPPEVRVQMISWTPTAYEPNIALYDRYGMHKIRQFWTMEIELDEEVPAPELPTGVTIRTIRYPEESRDLYRITDAAFIDHYGHIPDPEGVAYDRWAHHHLMGSTFDPSLWFVAEIDGTYAGFAWCRTGMPEDPKMGWVSTLGVLPAFRRRGIAGALLRYAFRELHGRGMHKVGLGVDATNITGANRVYERAGMRCVAKWDTYAKILRDGVEIVRET